MAFLDGFWVEKPHPNAPSFILAKVSLNVEKLQKALKESGEKFINLDIKESKEGTFYAQIDEWKPEQKGNQEIEKESGDSQDLPF